MEANYLDLYEANCRIIQQLQFTNEQQEIEIDSLKLQLAQIRKLVYVKRTTDLLISIKK